jgi:hypothetical protein
LATDSRFFDMGMLPVTHVFAMHRVVDGAAERMQGSLRPDVRWSGASEWVRSSGEWRSFLLRSSRCLLTSQHTAKTFLAGRRHCQPATFLLSIVMVTSIVIR